jgi:hypothetical protein
MVPMTRKPKRRTVACPETPVCVDPLALLARAKVRGVLADAEHDLAIRLLLRRAGLSPNIITKGTR